MAEIPYCFLWHKLCFCPALMTAGMERTTMHPAHVPHCDADKDYHEINERQFIFKIRSFIFIAR
jgi:hypothetical protein